MAPLLSSLFLTLTLIMLANNVRSQGDMTSFQIDAFTPSSEDLTYERDAFVPDGTSYLSLIGRNSSSSGLPPHLSVGRVLYSHPVNFWEPGRQASFETTIKFDISTFPNLGAADGMTFFIVPVNSTVPTGGTAPDLGIFGAVVEGSPIFAVEFDIWVNPFDPNFRHIGIDINSRTSANVTRFEGAFGTMATARINYDAPTRRIDVVATYGPSETTAAVSYVYDLKTLLPQQVQVGMSASIGNNAPALFDVFSWYFTSSLVWDGNTDTKSSVM